MEPKSKVEFQTFCTAFGWEAQINKIKRRWLREFLDLKSTVLGYSMPVIKIIEPYITCLVIRTKSVQPN